MNCKNILAYVALAAAPLGASALPTSFYSASSPMGKGNWVRVGVEQTGVYEITYDQLREMGFSNPSAVAVYGGGGRQMSEHFTDAQGNPLVMPDIPSVKVLHSDNKLYFYALGVEDIRFTPSPDLELGGSFLKKSRNIYSHYGYYFLTDATAPVAPETLTLSADPEAAPLTRGAGYVYHEIDLSQNNTNTGQLFWGESYFTGPSLNTWDVELPDLLGGQPGAMECKFYTSKGLNNGYTTSASQIKLGYGVGKNIKEGTPAAYFPVENQTNVANFIPQEPSLSGLTVPAGTDKVFVEYELGHSRSWDLSALDHWVLTYPKGIPTLRDSKGRRISQDLIAFPDLKNVGETRSFELADAISKTVWDVTDPANPIELPVILSGATGTVTVTRSAFDAVPTLAIFDRMSTQNRICGFQKGWERIANQNIHALQEKGCDMAIITLPYLYEGAKKIAALHEREYGDIVHVFTAQEVYNEFSGGVPDPMAYRSLVKMFYQSRNRQIKNVLLLGPLYADFRGMKVPVDPERALIAYQVNELNLETSAMNANDIHGVLTDYFNNTSIEKQIMSVGVGVMPIYSVDELNLYVDKLERFMTDDSFAYRLTGTLNIGGVGDNHMHDTQAVQFADYYNSLINSSAINTVVPIDAYGYEQSRNKWKEAFNSGRHFATYYGHGGPTCLGQNRLFFTSAHVPQFRNTPLPFMAFFGCSISESDHGIRGLGESMVFDIEHGLIGTLLATRSTWSGQNFDFSKLFFTSFYCTNPNSAVSAYEQAPLTLGEVLKKAKNTSLYANELAYQLLADPGLIYPVALQRVAVTTPAFIAGGQTLKLSGTIQKIGSSQIDEDFNGEIVVRVLEPAVDMITDDLVTGPGNDPLKVKYSDEQVSMSVARVMSGRFEVELFIPASVSRHEGRNCSLNFCAYNPKTRVGASALKIAAVNSNFVTVNPVVDTTAPVIESVTYDHRTKSISVTATDNVALDLTRNMLVGGFQAYIDGRYNADGSSSEPKLLGEGPRSYTREFPVGDLPAGHHSARVMVKDACGNMAESEITFTISPDAGKYVLALRENGLADSATFYVDGEMPESAVIYITSPEGTELVRLPYRASADVKWDGTDASGNRVAPGRYRAHLRETGSHQSKGHADVIIVPVL